MEHAREAFEQVKGAYLKLQDEAQKKVIIMNIEYVKTETMKDRRRLISKGVNNYEYDASMSLIKFNLSI